MKLNTLHDVLEDHIRDTYSAEQQIVRTLPNLREAAHSSELKEAIENHLSQTKEHIRRLDKVASHLRLTAEGKKCVAMEGLLREGEDVVRHGGTAEAIDAALIAAIQKVEHYEIASYGTAKAFARKLGYDDVVDLFDETLQEEIDTDEQLTDIAESSVNEQANEARA